MVKIPLPQSKLSDSELNYSSMYSNRGKKPLVMKCSEIKPSSSSIEKDESKNLKKLEKKSVNHVEGVKTLETSITNIEEAHDELRKTDKDILGEFLFATFSFDILLPEKKKDFFQNSL